MDILNDLNIVEITLNGVILSSLKIKHIVV